MVSRLAKREEAFFEQVLKEMKAAERAAAELARIDIAKQHGYEVKDAFSGRKVGFLPDLLGAAWIELGPANNRFVKWLIRKGVASKRIAGKGAMIYYPIDLITLQEYRARAAANVLKKYKNILGLKYVYTRSRLD